jgi:3-oxoacyl-[acyl-carrier-protein] synthase-1
VTVVFQLRLASNEMLTQNAPVPITGFALCNALGATREAVREALHAGRSGLGPSPIAVPFPTAVGAIDVPLPTLPSELSAWTTRTARLAMLLLEQLALPLERLRTRVRSDRIAVILGTSTAGADVTEDAYRHYAAHHKLPDDYDLWRHHTYGALLHVVQTLAGATGPAWVVSTACTSSAKPLATAQRLIASGMADAALVGGIDTLCSMTLRGFYGLDSLSPGACKPFSSARDGISIGEGGALLVLERDAEGIALLEAVGESSDAYHISAPHPEGIGARTAMERALAQAGCSAHDIDHVNAHGTGTRLNDSAEAKAISALLGDEVPVVSTKGYTGHMLGGAGASEAVIAMFALLEGWLPPSLGAEPRDPAITLNIPTVRTTGRFRRVLSNSFAFGGNNVSVLLRAV